MMKELICQIQLLECYPKDLGLVLVVMGRPLEDSEHSSSAPSRQVENVEGDILGLQKLIVWSGR